jgi:hypothetical protein
VLDCSSHLRFAPQLNFAYMAMKSTSSPKAASSLPGNPLLARFTEPQRKVLLAGLIAFFLLAAATTLLLAYYIYEPEITSWLQKPTSIFNPTPVSQSVLPTQMIIPTSTPSCSEASLQLGASSWRLESIQRNADGSVNVPSDTPGVAYWIKDLQNNNVFALSPTETNLDIFTTLQGGDEATITWENCNTATFTLFAPKTGNSGAEIFSDQLAIGLIVYIPESPSSSGMLVQGGLAGETITTPPTAEPFTGEVNAEISLLETSPSDDQKTIQVVISILNYGSEPITLLPGDISLIAQGAAPLTFLRTDPQLPQQIEPAKSMNFTLIFPRPDTSIATLKIYTVEYDLEDY